MYICGDKEAGDGVKIQLSYTIDNELQKMMNGKTENYWKKKIRKYEQSIKVGALALSLFVIFEQLSYRY